MLQIEKLCKTFGSREALRGIDFKLADGETYGLLGPNGAGKTTTLKILAGLLLPDQGTILLDGQPFSRTATTLKRQIAYVPDQPFLYAKLTGEEHLHFYADLYQLPRAKRIEKIDFFFRFFEFESYRRELVESYSAGTRQKLLISQALLVEPRVLLLDEPLVSIDPLVGRKFKMHLREVVSRGTMVLLATHILSLAQEACQRIGILIEGRLIVEGRVEELQARAGGNLEEFYFQTVLSHENTAQD